MAGNLRDYAENKILEHLVGKTAFAKPTVYVALYTTSPGEAGTGTEVSGGSYARIQTTAADWTTATNGSISNASTFEWNIASSNWGTVTTMALVDAPTGGNILVFGPATSSKTIEQGDTFRISAGNLTLTLD